MQALGLVGSSEAACMQDFLAPTKPPTFKKWPTERMVEFHMAAIRQQLGQVQTDFMIWKG